MVGYLNNSYLEGRTEEARAVVGKETASTQQPGQGDVGHFCLSNVVGTQKYLSNERL